MDQVNTNKSGRRYFFLIVSLGLALIFAFLFWFQKYMPPPLRVNNWISEEQFKVMLENDEVKLYRIIENRNVVEVFLTTAAKMKYSSNSMEESEEGNVSGLFPDLGINIDERDAFQERISKFYTSNPTVKKVSVEIKND